MVRLATAGHLHWHPGVARTISDPCTDERSADHTDQTTSVEDRGTVKTVAITRSTRIVRQGCERLPQHQTARPSNQRTLALVGMRSPRDLEHLDASSGDDRGCFGRVSVRVKHKRIRCRPNHAPGHVPKAERGVPIAKVAREGRANPHARADCNRPIRSRKVLCGCRNILCGQCGTRRQQRDARQSKEAHCPYYVECPASSRVNPLSIFNL